jgi:hypothetical protein
VHISNASPSSHKQFILFVLERDHELSFLQDNANKLKTQQASLNEEANNLNTQMTVNNSG